MQSTESTESAQPAAPAAGACTSPDPLGAGVHALIPTRASAAKKQALAARTDREHVRRELARLEAAIDSAIEKAESRLDGALRANAEAWWTEGGFRSSPATLWRIAVPLAQARQVAALFDLLIEAAS